VRIARSDGEEALRLAGSFRPDVILLDAHDAATERFPKCAGWNRADPALRGMIVVHAHRQGPATQRRTGNWIGE